MNLRASAIIKIVYNCKGKIRTLAGVVEQDCETFIVMADSKGNKHLINKSDIHTIKSPHGIIYGKRIGIVKR